MLAISQNPERVSNILRSSTRTTRVSGIGADSVRRRCGWTAGRWWWRSCRCPLSLGVGGELEEHLLESAAVGGAQLGERHAAVVAPRARPAAGSASVRSAPSSETVASRPAACQRPLEGADVRGADDGARPPARSSALEPWQTIRPLPIITMSSAMISISCSRCEDSRTVPPLVGVVAEQVPHPADAGRVEPVGRLVEDQHRRVADQGGGDAEALAHPERVVAHPPVGLGLGEADQVEHLVDPAGRDSP